MSFMRSPLAASTYRVRSRTARGGVGPYFQRPVSRDVGCANDFRKALTSVAARTVERVDPALSSLAGVAVGGVATYWSQRALDTRRDERETRASAAAGERATRCAACLVLIDLLAVITHMKATYESEAWLKGLSLPDGAWLEERHTLSEALDDNSFRNVASVFSSVAAWNDLVQALQASDPLSALAPRMRLKKSSDEGLSGLRDTLLSASGQAANSIRPLALPSIRDDDPLAVLFRQAHEHDTNHDG